MSELRLYKQEGHVGLFQILLPLITVTREMEPYLRVSYGDSYVYARNGYITDLLQMDKMEAVSRAFFEKAKDGFPAEWQTEWEHISHELMTVSKRIWQTDVARCNENELRELYREIFEADQHMWRISIFIDALDVGYDQVEIARITKQYGFTPHEVQILLTPTEQSYITEWEQKLWEVKQGHISPHELLDTYFWIGTDYVSFKETSKEDIQALAKEVSEPPVFESCEAEQAKILQVYGCPKNPFEVFQVLAVWRDERKKLNYAGLYGCMKLLGEVFRRQGIDSRLVSALRIEEATEVFNGSIVAPDQLMKREKDGVLCWIHEDGTLTYMEGEEAQKEFTRLSQFLPSTDVQEVKGSIACQGYCRGIVRVVASPDAESARAFQEGDILVSSMTRPELVYLMRRAGAIVTDEGGISCHAAIVSRELKKPCIIGTKIATKVLKDGDEVEVDANAGIVKILKRA